MFDILRRALGWLSSVTGAATTYDSEFEFTPVAVPMHFTPAANQMHFTPVAEPLHFTPEAD